MFPESGAFCFAPGSSRQFCFTELDEVFVCWHSKTVISGIHISTSQYQTVMKKNVLNIWNLEQMFLWTKLFGNQQLSTSNTNETHWEGRSTQMHIPVFNVRCVCVAKRFGSVYAQNGDPNLICKKVFCFSEKWSTSTSWFGLWKWPTKKQFLRMNLALNPWGVSVDLPSHVSFPQNHISRQIWADWREPRGFSGS